MVEQTPRYGSYDPDIDTHDKALIDRRLAPYKFGQPARTDSHTEDSVPLFLSDYDGEPDPSEYMAPLRKVGTNSGGRLGDCGRGNSICDVFFGCHTRHHC